MTCTAVTLERDPRRALLSLLGLGSVSAAVLAAADVPVAVIRKDVQLSAAPAVLLTRCLTCLYCRAGCPLLDMTASILRHVRRQQNG